MNLLKQFPELEHFEREDVPGVASEALTFAKHEVMRTWRFWLTLLALAGLYMTATTLAVWTITQRFGSSEWVHGVAGGCCGAVVSLAAWRLFRERIRRHLCERLVQLGVPICIPCGYDLRGSTERCPECGTTIEIVVK